MLHFETGMLSIERGTTLRAFLASRLHCPPMRISKKFAGSRSLGKQVFEPRSPHRPLTQRQEQLAADEAAHGTLARLEKARAGLTRKKNAACHEEKALQRVEALAFLRAVLFGDCERASERASEREREREREKE